MGVGVLPTARQRMARIEHWSKASELGRSAGRLLAGRNGHVAEGIVDTLDNQKAVRRKKVIQPDLG